MCMFVTIGSITMALLENLRPGQVYLIKVSASNNMGDGPFSSVVELTVRADLSTGHDAGLSRGSTHSTGRWNPQSRIGQCLLLACCRRFFFFSKRDWVVAWCCFMLCCIPGFSDGFYHLDQKSMTGISVGVCIALTCIMICAFIIICRGKNRYLVSLIAATYTHLFSLLL